MSPNGLWSKELMGGTEGVKDPLDDDEVKQAGYLDALKKAFVASFGITEPKAAAESASGKENMLVSKKGSVTVNDVTFDAPFWVAEVVSKHSFYNDTEDYFAYTNLDTLIKYINVKLKSGESLFTYKMAKGKAGDIHPIYEIGSADPTKVVLPGEYSKYGPDAFNWRAKSIENNHKDAIRGILLSIEYMNKVYLELSTDSTSKKGGKKQPPTIEEFLSKIFNDIEQLTGGLVSIITLPTEIDQGSTPTSDKPSTIIIVNRRKTVDTAAKIEPYPFETLSKRSITKSISLSSDTEICIPREGVHRPDNCITARFK